MGEIVSLAAASITIGAFVFSAIAWMRRRVEAKQKELEKIEKHNQAVKEKIESLLAGSKTQLRRMDVYIYLSSMQRRMLSEESRMAFWAAEMCLTFFSIVVISCLCVFALFGVLIFAAESTSIVNVFMLIAVSALVASLYGLRSYYQAKDVLNRHERLNDTLTNAVASAMALHLPKGEGYGLEEYVMQSNNSLHE